MAFGSPRPRKMVTVARVRAGGGCLPRGPLSPIGGIRGLSTRPFTHGNRAIHPAYPALSAESAQATTLNLPRGRRRRCQSIPARVIGWGSRTRFIGTSPAIRGSIAARPAVRVRRYLWSLWSFGHLWRSLRGHLWSSLSGHLGPCFIGPQVACEGLTGWSLASRRIIHPLFIGVKHRFLKKVLAPFFRRDIIQLSAGSRLADLVPIAMGSEKREVRKEASEKTHSETQIPALNGLRRPVEMTMLALQGSKGPKDQRTKGPR